MRLYKKSYHKSQFWLQQIISSNDQLIFFPMFFICPLFLYNLNNNLVPPIHDVWLKVNKNNLTKKNVTVVQIDWGVKGNKLDAVTKLAFGWRLRMVSRAQIEPCTFFRMSSLLCSRSSLFFSRRCFHYNYIRSSFPISQTIHISHKAMLPNL